jgi:3-hydroxyacyl-CoA dehydrogenase
VLKDKVARGEYGLKSGKGFYDWTRESRSAVVKRKDQQLVSMLKFFRAEVEAERKFFEAIPE